ncbi:MAG: hypothetical protein RIB60_08780 [Phycisphaerales bacterium]
MNTHIVLLTIAVLTAAQPNAAPTESVPAVPTDAAALEQLRPRQPIPYLHLAEDMLARDTLDDAQRTRIIELLVRAAVLTLDTDPQAAASACLALTDERLDLGRDDRAWVRAVAHTLDPSLNQPSWIVDPDAPTNATAGASPLAAAALARLRNGDPRRAALLLDEPGVMQALKASPDLALVRAGLSVEAFFESYGDGWPCPTCRGDRFEATRQGTDTVYAICPHCQGDPGPRFTTDKLIILLRAERALVGGADSAWSASVGGVTGDPLRPPTPSQLPARLGVPADRFWWRDGRWVSSPAGD